VIADLFNYYPVLPRKTCVWSAYLPPPEILGKSRWRTHRVLENMSREPCALVVHAHARLLMPRRGSTPNAGSRYAQKRPRSICGRHFWSRKPDFRGLDWSCNGRVGFRDSERRDTAVSIAKEEVGPADAPALTASPGLWDS
jgi:hypothetical protein